MASADEKIVALERANAAMQMASGRLQQLTVDEEQEMRDDRQRQTAAMNIVMDQTRAEVQGGSSAIRHQGDEIKKAVEESTREFQAIKQGCEEFGKKVEVFATKVEQDKEGIKSVIAQIAQGHAQEIGAVKQ